MQSKGEHSHHEVSGFSYVAENSRMSRRLDTLQKQNDDMAAQLIRVQADAQERIRQARDNERQASTCFLASARAADGRHEQRDSLRSKPLVLSGMCDDGDDGGGCSGETSIGDYAAAKQTGGCIAGRDDAMDRSLHRSARGTGLCVSSLGDRGNYACLCERVNLRIRFSAVLQGRVCVCPPRLTKSRL